MSGQKELGNVHEIEHFTRSKKLRWSSSLRGRKFGKRTTWIGIVALLTLNRPMKKAVSRWIGEGQFLSYRVCQAIRPGFLQPKQPEPSWSQQGNGPNRRDSSGISLGLPARPHSTAATAGLGRFNGGWTFGGGMANTILTDHFGGDSKAKADNLCIRFSSTLKLDDVESLIASKSSGTTSTRVPSEEAIEKSYVW